MAEKTAGKKMRARFNGPFGIFVEGVHDVSASELNGMPTFTRVAECENTQHGLKVIKDMLAQGEMDSGTVVKIMRQTTPAIVCKVTTKPVVSLEKQE